MRESSGDAAVRHRLVRLAVLPAGLIAVAGAAVVAYVLRVQGGAGTADAPAGAAAAVPVWSVLTGGLALVCAVLVTAALLASSEARNTVERYAAVRRSVAHGRTELRAVLGGLERGERPRVRTHAEDTGTGPHAPPPAGDALDLLAHEVTLAQRSAESAVAEAAAVVRSTYSGSEEKVEVFVNLARRLQSLVHREIELLDELENEVEDPDLLKGLFHVDHLATRIRRHAENLAVLGGAVSRRQWTRPVGMTEVLRSSIAEVEQYPRVKLVPPIEGTLRGHAVADVIHLLAELIENATVFSAPQTQVLLRAQHVTAGLAIEVEDRGLGMTAGEQNHMNAVLSEPERIDVPELLRDGRIGLFVVSALARRHGVVVQLQSNIYGGVQAVLVLPSELLGDDQCDDRSGAASGSGTYAGTQAGRSRAERVGAVRPEDGGPAGALSVGTGALPMPEPGTRHQPPTPPGPRTPPPPHPQAQPLPQRTVRPPAPGRRPGLGRQPAAGPGRVAAPEAGEPSPGPLPEERREQERQGQRRPEQERPGQERPEQERPEEERPEPQRLGALVAGGGRPNSPTRPRLPKRRRQEHLVPELRDPPAHIGARAEAVASEGHDPGLMAAFQRGTRLADEVQRDPGPSPEADGAGNTTPAIDGDPTHPAR